MSTTPNYVVNEDVHFWYEWGQDKVIPSGTFVRPIAICYVPKHIISDQKWRFFDANKETFCYTRYGIVPIPWNKIRKV